MIISKEINGKGTTEYHLVAMGTWDFFSDFSLFFEQQYGAVVQVKRDDIYTREWQFYCRNEYFIFKHHEDIGNWFYSCNENGDSVLLDEISNDIEARIKD